QGPNNTKLVASVNNVPFVQPNIALLQAHFFNKVKGVFATDFPANPLIKFNNTSTPPSNTKVNNGTKAGVFPFNTSVELVMQDTSIIGAESHPLHLHGFNFFVLGQDIGNFNPRKDHAKFNLFDPAKRNTVGVPSGGWVAIRFLANNLGILHTKQINVASLSLMIKEKNQKEVSTNNFIHAADLFFFVVVVLNYRSLVYALPFGSVHQLGLENGLG
ncbi:hypothetical protein Gohar_021626, partial [Gossypium harknessii]|nr:hypothetical protein [Gossypium harknessii]